MGQPIRLLLIEDTERDAALLQLFLRRAGFDSKMTRIETEVELREELSREKWDVIVSDVHLPRFSAQQALGVLREAGISMPFFAYSGAIDEATAAQLHAAGAAGYFDKTQTAKLVAAISEAAPKPE
jgi:DNA-binding NtrC family response regulator